MKKGFIFFVIVLLGLEFSLQADAATLLFSEGFEGKAVGDLAGNPNINNPPLNSSELGCKYPHDGANCPKVSIDVARSGSKSMKTFTCLGPLPCTQPDTGHVSRIHSEAGKGPSTFFQDFWYGFSTNIPNNRPATSGYEIIAQWHSITDAAELTGNASPPLAINVDPSRLILWRRWNQCPNCPQQGPESTDLGLWTPGQWIDWVFHIRWSWQNNGVLQVWKNGQLIIDRQNIPMGYWEPAQPQDAPNFKFGTYRNGTTDTRTMYHDNIRMATAAPGEDAYDVVNPGGPPHTPQCADTLDNDGDGLTDYPADPGCTSSTDNDETNTPPSTSCNQYTPSTSIPAAFASPFWVASNPSQLLLNVTCPSTGSASLIAGTNAPNVFVYKNVYVHKDGAWQLLTVSGTPVYNGNWYQGTVTASSLPFTNEELTTTRYAVAYVCTWTGTWKCGCRTNACMGEEGNKWSLMGFRKE